MPSGLPQPEPKRLTSMAYPRWAHRVCAEEGACLVATDNNRVDTHGVATRRSPDLNELQCEWRNESRRTEAWQILNDVFGYSSFRPLQENVVEAILNGQDTFVLMPTGGGKSLCYQVPALVLEGITVVISPLIALMKDQVDALRAIGVAATYINSSLDSAEIQRRQRAVARGDIKLLYVAPERFATQRFLSLLEHAHVSMFAIDEAHCISEWGHDFRPDYRELSMLCRRFPRSVIAAFTATATDRVQQDIRHQLGLRHPAVFHASFNRPNLFYEVRSKDDAFGQILEYLRGHENASGIIYCGSRATTEDLAARLSAAGYDAAAYHAGLNSESRGRVQEAFVRDDVRIIVATIAFGMGIDKPDVRFVMHYDLPRNLEGYYQESGRAGRDGDAADCILYYSYGDVARQQFFIGQRPNQALQDHATRQLREMSAWAEERSCRRIALLRYFGEEFAGQGHPCCDNCREPHNIVDYTIPAQMFLSCVKRTGERFGSAYVIDVLRGSRADRILKFGHDRLSTHGIGHGYSKHEWQYLARELIKRGYAIQDPEQFNSIRIAASGYDVLFKGSQVLLPSAPAEARRKLKRVDGPADVEHPELFDRLRQLRKRIADERSVPPYVIFPNATLRSMASMLPNDDRAFRAINGVGERKLTEFGGLFLREIRNYVQQTGATPIPSQSPVLRERRSRQPGLSASARHTLAMFHDGIDPRQIARERNLSISTIEDHLVEAIEAGYALAIERLVSRDVLAAVDVAMRSDPEEDSLRALKDRVGEGYSYADVKLARAAIRASKSIATSVKKPAE